MFMAGTANPFVGPAPTGIIGGIGFIVVAVLCYVSLKEDRRRIGAQWSFKEKQTGMQEGNRRV